jgi:hypothetical protein
MKNKLIRLNNHLFEQLERLNDADLKSEELQEEMSRAKAITGVANQIINNARLVFEATKALSEGLIRETEQGNYMLGMLNQDGADKIKAVK